MADRMGPLRTAMGRFVERVNGGRISDGAVVLPATALGVDDLTLGVIEGAPSVRADLVSVVVPGGALDIEIAAPTLEQTILLVPGPAVGDEPFGAAAGVSAGNDRVLELPELLPARSWTATGDDDEAQPGSGWLTWRARIEKIEIAVEKVERAKSAWVPTGTEPWAVTFGFDGGDLPGRRTEGGEAFDPERTLLALTGRALVETWPGDGPPDALTEGLDLGRTVPAPAPLGGVTFGVGVLSTPLASVAGESANPLSRVGTADLFRREEARGMLARAGVTDAEDVAWTAGPEPVDPDEGPSTATLLGSETEVESFVGVVEGESGPWGVGVHVARVDDDDHVIVAGIHRRAVGSPEASEATLGALRDGPDVIEARRLFAATVAELELG